jgi:hypothetical protein
LLWKKKGVGLKNLVYFKMSYDLILFFQLNILDITLLILKMKKVCHFIHRFFFIFENVCQTLFEKTIFGWIYAVDRLNDRCVFLKYILKFMICVGFLNMLALGVLLHITINISPVNEFFTGLFMFFINFDNFCILMWQHTGFQSHLSSKLIRLPTLIFSYVVGQSLKAKICKIQKKSFRSFFALTCSYQ